MINDDKNWIIKSPNNWIVRAGAYVSDGKIVMPHKFLLIPLALASEAVEIFNKENSWKKRLESVQAIAINVRNAETAFFRKVSEIINEINKNGSKIEICEKCIRDNLFDTNLKEIRRAVNSKIIHKMESGEAILMEDFHFAIDYYNEIFKLPLINPIHWEAKTFKPCKDCLEKNKKNGLLLDLETLNQ
jgi:predicted peroxiredoxin